MTAAGICGARVNLETTQETDHEKAKYALAALAEQLRGRDWHIQFDTRPSVIKELRRQEIASLPFPVVFSHFGRARAALGTSQPGFDDLLELLSSGQGYVKLSAPDRVSDQRPDYPNVATIARALVAANPDRVLWATNWPHTGRAASPAIIAPPCPNDDGHALNLLPIWVPEASVRKKILVDNPFRLYGF